MAERINQRFRDGHASNDLDSVGVVIHQFDETENPDMPWKRCPQFCHGFGQLCGCHFLMDRITGSSISAAMPRNVDGSMPIWSPKAGGIIFRGSSNKLLCAFAGDGGTRARVCDPPGTSEHCTPGCTDKYNPWCEMSKVVRSQDVWCDGNPWRPDGLRTMLDGWQRRKPPWNTFNEVVFDGEHAENQLPGSIEAFFYLLNDMCPMNDLCKQHTERMHWKFLREYHVTSQEYPLLGLRLDEWNNPFVVVPPAPPPGQTEY